MDKSAIDTPSREIDLRNIPVHLRTALRRGLEFEARAPAPRSAEEAEQCEEQLRAIADEFFGALLTPVLQRAVCSGGWRRGDALVRHLLRRTERPATAWRPSTIPGARRCRSRRSVLPRETRHVGRSGGRDSNPPWLLGIYDRCDGSWPPMQDRAVAMLSSLAEGRRSSAPTASPWMHQDHGRSTAYRYAVRGPERPRARRATCWTA